MKKVILLLLFCQGVMLYAQQMQPKQNDYVSITNGKTKIPSKNITQELINNTPEAFQSHPDFGIPPVNAPKGAIELVQKRTLDSRYYIKEGTNGQSFFKQQAYGAINYTDAQGYLRAIDYLLLPTNNEGVFAAASQPTPTSIDFINNFTSIHIRDLDFRMNHDMEMYFEKGNTTTAKQRYNTSNYTVGRDGTWITDIFSGVDGEIAFRKAGIKTNFIIKSKEVVDPDAEWLVIDDHIALPPGYQFVYEDGDGYFLSNGDWKGNVVVKNPFGLNLLRIERPVILDQNKSKYHKQDQVDAIAYQLIPEDGGYILRMRVNVKWLINSERKYPVVIDPTLIGEATYTAGDIGFEYDALCWNEADYCSYSLDITVPGKTTLTAAYFDGTYYSQNFGCFFVTDCLMSEAAFRILGICDDSPGPASFWTCLPPVGDSAGTCYGIDLPMFNTIACIPPQCADYNFTFEMRTYHCSCTQPPCSILCHFMPTGSWVITIEGKTVEENPIQSSTVPDFVICEGDSIDLFASGVWGVPPYTYEWLPGGVVEPIHWVAPTTTTTYTSVIHDACDMTDTVSQTVTVNPAPIIEVGPFEGCYLTTMTAPGGYDSYVWTDANDSVLATGTNTLTVDSTGMYFVTVTDGNGCVGTSEPIEAFVYEAPVINAFPDTVFVNDGALALLQVETITGDDVTYTWTPADAVNCINCATTLAYSVGESNTFYVTGEEHGCVSAPDSIVVIMEESELIIPNAFTPNDDGLNDEFNILNPIFYPIFSFEIYNRWGQQVFATSDVTRGWDGNYDGKPQEIGMYVWMVSYEKANQPGEVFVLRGTVTLLR